MAKVTMTLTLRFPWWWRWFYMPLTLFAARLGLPINEDLVVADMQRAARVYVNGKRCRMRLDEPAEPRQGPPRFIV